MNEWIRIDLRPPMLEGLGENDADVWTWDGEEVREDTYGLIFEQPAGPAVGGWLCVGEGFGCPAVNVTHWMPRVPPEPPTAALATPQALPTPQAERSDTERDAELLSLRKFVGKVLGDFPEHGDIDGFALQDIAVECGLLVEQLTTAPCGEACQCADCGQQGVTMCYRIQPALREAMRTNAPATSEGAKS